VIRFGTNGWRAVMGEAFTFHNVRLCVQAIANVLRAKFPGRDITVIVNYDTRFLSERYAAEAAKVLSHNRIQVLLAERDAPTQAQACQIIRRGAQGGINFTASFNPPEYNGLKYATETGAPALPSETAAIEAEIGRLEKSFAYVPLYPRSEAIERIDLRADYLAYLQEKIDFRAIRESGLRIGIDLLYGTSREYLDEILEENGIEVEELHGFVDPYFGGMAPSCTEENLAELVALVKDRGCHLGLATDADGDRFGIVDPAGGVLLPNLVLGLLLSYLVSQRGWQGGVARSVATTHYLDRIARVHDLPLTKTPVGFKFIADLLLRDEIMFGGEESAALGLRGFLPEKDGIAAGLLVAEMVAKTGRSLAELLGDMEREYGERFGGQRDVPLTPSREKSLRKLVKSPPTKMAGRYVVNVETIDGIKLDFADDDWLLVRFSGTEPLVRCYAEARSRKDLRELLKAGLDKIG
jgi:phosphoglucomutase